MFKGKLIELPQLEHPLLIYETSPLVMIICLCFFNPANPVIKPGNWRIYFQKTKKWHSWDFFWKENLRQTLSESPKDADNPGKDIHFDVGGYIQ